MDCVAVYPGFPGMIGDSHRRTGLKVLVAFGFEFSVKVDVERGEKLALLVLRRYDLELVAKLLAQQGKGLFIQRLRGRGHFAEVEEYGHQCSGVRLDLVGKVRDGRAATETDNGVAVAAGHAYATQRRSTHLLEFLALGTLRLALLATACAALTEGTLCAAATAAALAEAAACRSTATGTRSATGTRCAAWASGAAASAAGTAGTSGCGTFGAVRHHAGSRTVSAACTGTCTGSTGRTRGARTCALCAGGTGSTRTGTTCAGCRTRAAGAFALSAVSARTGHAL